MAAGALFTENQFKDCVGEVRTVVVLWIGTDASKHTRARLARYILGCSTPAQVRASRAKADEADKVLWDASDGERQAREL